MDKSNSLFQRIGGTDTVNAAATIFYKKVITDKSLNQLFPNPNPDRLKKKQKAFLAHAFGIPEKTPKHKRVAIKILKLTENHFNLFLGYLIDTLRELNVPKDMIDEVLGNVSETNELITTA